ncbi:hypothetical protein L7F22_006979 [Adiantum nelumboides]|nr:hypothetical protein [Adiantum nelumboides]
MEEAARTKKLGKPCGPSYKLKYDIELGTDLKKVFEERMNSKVELTLGEILGIAKCKFHEEVIDIIKSKRQLLAEQEAQRVQNQMVEIMESILDAYKEESNEEDDGEGCQVLELEEAITGVYEEVSYIDNIAELEAANQSQVDAFFVNINSLEMYEIIEQACAKYEDDFVAKVETKYKTIAKKFCPVTTPSLEWSDKVMEKVLQQPMLRDPRNVGHKFTEETLKMLKVGEDGFLTKKEIKCFKEMLSSHGKAFSFASHETGCVDPNVVAPMVIFTVSHMPWNLRPILVPKAHIIGYQEHKAGQVLVEIKKAKQSLEKKWRDLGKKPSSHGMPHQKQAKQWAKGPYEVDELLTHEKSHITDDVLAQIPAHIFIVKFKDAEGDNIKTTIMPREIWMLHRKPEVVNVVRAIHLDQFFRPPPWGTDYMRAHELMSSIQYDGQALLTGKDDTKARVLITTDIINEAMHFYLGTYDLLAKTKSIDNEKAFIKAKGHKYKYSDMIYNELELPLRLISQHFKVQKPPMYTEPLLHIAIVMALAMVEARPIHYNYGKFILENLVEAILKGSAKNKLYMSAGPMLTRIAYQALDMIKDLPVAASHTSLIQHARFVSKPVKTTTTTTSSRTTSSSKKSLSDDQRTDTDNENDSQGSDKEGSQKGAKAKGPLLHERSDEEDTSTPLDKKRKKLRLETQVTYAEAQARVETRNKMLAKARAAKAAKLTIPMTMEQVRLARIEKPKALQEEKRRLEAE